MNYLTLFFILLFLISGCSSAINQSDSVFLTQNEVHDWEQTKKLPSKFKIELNRDFTPGCEGCQNADHYWASLYFKFDDLYIGTQRYSVSDGTSITKNYDCVYDLTNKRWVTEENREPCDFQQYMFFPLNKEHLQRMINNREVVECTNNLQPGTLCHEIKLPAQPEKLPSTFILSTRYWKGVDGSLAFNNNEIVYVTDENLKGFNKERLQGELDQGKLVPCNDISTYIMPYDNTYPCYYITPFNPIQLPGDVTITLLKYVSSAATSTNYNTILTFSREKLISGTLVSEYWPNSGGVRIVECKADTEKLVWVAVDGGKCTISESNQPPLDKNEIQNLINIGQIRLLEECETRSSCFKFKY